jgi:hypothetical protein
MKQSVLQAPNQAAGTDRSNPPRLRLPAVDINRLGAALAAGAVLGATVGGIGARVAMRVVALLGDGQPSFTVAGVLGIVIMGAALGAAGGLGFALLCGLMRMAWGEETSPLRRSIGAGAVYGGGLALLAALPFFLNPVGELALAPPLVGAALFAWIPLVYGLALGAALPSVERRLAATPRAVGLGWLATFALALVLALAGMAPLLGGFTPFPPAATVLHYSAGMSFAAVQALHRGLMLAFMATYCGLSVWIFWRGAHDRVARLAAVTLLLLAAAFFGRQPALSTGMQALPPARLLPDLLQAGALCLLLALLFVMPDGRWALRWTRPLAVIWCGWTLLWFVNPLPGTPLDVSAWPEPVLLAALVGGLGSGLAAMGWRARSGTPAQRRTVRPALIGFAAAFGSFALLALCALAAPELRLRALPLPQALLAFAPYLLPWLLLPLTLVTAMRRGLWSITRSA